MYKYRVVYMYLCMYSARCAQPNEKTSKFRNAALITHGEPFSDSIMAYANVLLAAIRCELFLQLFETPSLAV